MLPCPEGGSLGTVMWIAGAMFVKQPSPLSGGQVFIGIRIGSAIVDVAM